MAISSESKSTPKSWRFPLAMGMGMGVGIGTARAVERNFESSIGQWGAFLVGLIAAASIAGLVSLAVAWLIKPRTST
jgi:high-affinity Fe2+/Pb2+ permease